MDNDDLEKNSSLSKIIVGEEVSMGTKIMEILDRIEYNDFPIWKKNKINGLIEDIKKANKKEDKENAFFELIKLMESE